MDIEAAADSFCSQAAGPLDLAALLKGAQEAMMKSGETSMKDGGKSNKSRSRHPPKALPLPGIVGESTSI